MVVEQIHFERFSFFNFFSFFVLEELLKHCKLDHKKEVEQLNCIQDHVTWQNKTFTPYFDCNICKEQLPTFGMKSNYSLLNELCNNFINVLLQSQYD